MSRYLVIPSMLWIQQCCCVYAGTLPWYGVFFIPSAVAIGAIGCWLWWRWKERT